MKSLDRSPLAQLQTIRPLLFPCVLIGLYAILVTFGKDFEHYWPLKPGGAGWRFGALGFFLGSGAVPVLGLALMAVAGAIGEFRGVSRAVGVIGIFLGVAVLAGLVIFFVDSRVVLAGAGTNAPLVTGAVRRTAVLALLSGPAYLALGLAGFRAAREMAPRVVDSKSGLVSAGAP
jgi:hypothetical protein